MSNRFLKSHTLILAIGLGAGLPATAVANGYDASNMWGTAPGGVSVPGALESATMHTQNGVGAGQVNAAKAGQLITTGSAGSFQAIGSQTVITSTVYGDNNVTDIDAEQSSSNSGDVTLNNNM